jgi:hypothetical protein
MVYFFWKSASPASQWHPSTFTIDNEEYCCAEQWMMRAKAKLFDAPETEVLIMKCRDPRRIKALGGAKYVPKFDSKTWEAHRFDIVVRGNYAKFSQNPNLRDWLLATKDEELIESSPVDRIYGIGYTAEDAVKVDRSLWGLNLLGKALMEVRTQLRSEQ